MLVRYRRFLCLGLFLMPASLRAGDLKKIDFVHDIAPVSAINRVAVVIEVNPSFAPQTLAELIAYAKANSGKVDIGSPSTGTPPFMAVEMLKMMAGIDIVHVPYAAEAQMVTDLLGGQLKVAASGISPPPSRSTGRSR